MTGNQPFARAVHTSAARLDPTIWRVSDITVLIDRARTGGQSDRTALLVACVERFQYMVRQILREDGFARVAPSVTEVVHDVFLGEMQAVLDATSIPSMDRKDLERIFRHKVRQHLLKLVARHRRGIDAEDPAQEKRERPGSDRVPRPDVVVERIEQEMLLLDALDNYPDEHVRDLLVQRYYFGRSLADLSLMTGDPVSTIHSRIRAAEDRIGRACVAGLADLGGQHRGGGE